MEREAASELTRVIGVLVKVGVGGGLVGVALGRGVLVGSGVLVGRGVLVGGRAVLVASAGPVAVGRTMGVPLAAEVCWAERV